MGHPIRFIYPNSTQFPFDEVTREIVLALEARNFDVPGIRVEFSVYGSGAQKARMVSRIIGEGFHIYFGRRQGLLPGGDSWDDTAAVSRIAINQQRLQIDADESGPTLDMYTGHDWAADSENFLWGSKEDGKCRTYRGGYGYGRRSPVLKAKDPQDAEEFETARVLETFRTNLLAGPLLMIEAHPVAQERLDLWPEPDPIAVPAWAASSLFCYADNCDVLRICQGKDELHLLGASKADYAELRAGDQFGMGPYDMRLMPLDMDRGDLPNSVWDAFLWCGIREAGDLNPAPRIYGTSSWDKRLIRIQLKTANEVYIVDHAAFEDRRAELAVAAMHSDPGRKRFTGAEISDAMRARARTLIPITEYQGNYRQPVVLIGRELDFDEVEIEFPPQPEVEIEFPPQPEEATLHD